MNHRILVIEDDPPSLSLMEYLLRAYGNSPLLARDGVEGLDVARRERPDLILCDIQLPKLSGYEVAAGLKADPMTAGIPLVAMTALAMVGDREKIIAAGFDGYISKPITSATVVPEIEKYIESAASRPSNSPAVRTLPEAIKTPVNVLQGLDDLIPAYLSDCREGLGKTKGAAAVDFEYLAGFAHNLRGSGRSYGFPELSQFGNDLEVAARARDENIARRLLAQLDACLKRIEGRPL